MSKVKVTACKCDRCGHIWLGRIKDPVSCPHCKTNYWNRGKVTNRITNKVTKESTKKRIENGLYRNSQKYKEWRISVLKRDNYICQNCEKETEDLVVHHIQEFSKNKEIRFDIINGITLCKLCHKKIHSRENQKELPPTDRAYEKLEEKIELENTESIPDIKEPIPKRKPTKDEQKAFDCAFAMKFNCNFYATHTEHFQYCKHCFDAPFWMIKDRYLIAMEDKVDDKSINEDKSKWEVAIKNCPEFSNVNGVPNCYFRNIGQVKFNYCPLCWENFKMWGDKAVGYKEKENK